MPTNTPKPPNVSDIVMSHAVARRVIDGNRGAVMVVNLLLHRTHWYEMMEWLDRNDYRGGDLWILYKDVFKERLYDMGDFIMYMMDSKHYREQYGNYRDARLGFYMIQDYLTPLPK